MFVGTNACSEGNGGCEQICLPTPDGRLCVCPDSNKTACMPTIVRGPVSRKVVEGVSVTFHCRVANTSSLGYPTTSVVWMYNGSKQMTYNLSNMPSDNDAVLTIGLVTTSNGGVYSCRVGNKYGVVVSDNATLQVTSGNELFTLCFAVTALWLFALFAESTSPPTGTPNATCMFVHYCSRNNCIVVFVELVVGSSVSNVVTVASQKASSRAQTMGTTGAVVTTTSSVVTTTSSVVTTTSRTSSSAGPGVTSAVVSTRMPSTAVISNSTPTSVATSAATSTRIFPTVSSTTVSTIRSSSGGTPSAMTPVASTPSPPVGFLVVSETSVIELLDTKTFKPVYRTIEGLQRVVNVDCDMSTQQLFWVDSLQHWVAKQSLNSSSMNGTRKVIAKSVSVPYGIAVDWIGKQIFFTDQALDFIGVVSMDGLYAMAIPMLSVASPTSIALDPEKGYIQ